MEIFEGKKIMPLPCKNPKYRYKGNIRLAFCKNKVVEAKHKLKVTKLKANYKNKAKLKLCKNCTYYNYKSCSYVKGVISPNGTCKYWRKLK